MTSKEFGRFLMKDRKRERLKGKKTERPKNRKKRKTERGHLVPHSS